MNVVRGAIDFGHEEEERKLQFVPSAASFILPNVFLIFFSGKAGHGSFPMRVVGSRTTTNLVRTNHTDFYFVSTRLHIFISVV